MKFNGTRGSRTTTRESGIDVLAYSAGLSQIALFEKFERAEGRIESGCCFSIGLHKPRKPASVCIVYGNLASAATVAADE